MIEVSSFNFRQALEHRLIIETKQKKDYMILNIMDNKTENNGRKEENVPQVQATFASCVCIPSQKEQIEETKIEMKQIRRKQI